MRDMDAAPLAPATLAVGSDRYLIVDLPALASPRLPVVLRLLLENVARHMRGEERQAAIAALNGWLDTGSSLAEIAFQPGRVLMHDTTSTPALVDIAAMRDALAEAGVDPARLNPVLPVDVSVDHSLAVQAYARPDAARLNIGHEIRRNGERYRFLRWAQSALRGVRIHPPGTGIMHTINLEQLATLVQAEMREGRRWAVPDMMLGTDSHTPMINGIGVLGWGVGGLEAQTVMFGMPTMLRIPDVIGVELTGALPSGVLATDLALAVTERLRALGVSGEFVEFFGPGVSAAGRAAELQAQHTGACLGQALAMAFDGVQRLGQLQAQRDRQGLLHPAAAGHDGVAMQACLPGQGRGQRLQARVDLLEGGAQLQQRGAVDDVLAGRAPMDVARGFGVFAGDGGGQLLDQGNGQIAGQGRCFLEASASSAAVWQARSMAGTALAGMTPCAAQARARPASTRSMARSVAAPSQMASMAGAPRNLSVRSFMLTSSEIEEDGLGRPLQMDVEEIDGGAAGLAPRDQRPAPLRFDGGQDGVALVGCFFVIEIDAGVGMQQHAAHMDDDVDGRRPARAGAPGLTVRSTKRWAGSVPVPTRAKPRKSPPASVA